MRIKVVKSAEMTQEEEERLQILLDKFQTALSDQRADEAKVALKRFINSMTGLAFDLGTTVGSRH